MQRIFSWGMIAAEEFSHLLPVFDHEDPHTCLVTSFPGFESGDSTAHD